jgi:hypothetical protein
MQDSSKPIWIKKEKPKIDFSIMVSTPVHSEVSIHYTQALLEFQKNCFSNKIPVAFQLMKSSLVTQGRNLCVAGFLDSECTHMLFIDSDIDFQFNSIMKMIKADKEVISIPYPLKTFNSEKIFSMMKEGKITEHTQIQKNALMYPLKLPDPDDIQMKNGIVEVTHVPTGSMLIKRSVFEKMIKAYPDLFIKQGSIINGKLVDKPNMWNFFDTWFDKETHTYLGEDFAFCKRWSDIGGKCYALASDYITHIGEYSYCGRLQDEFVQTQ